MEKQGQGGDWTFSYTSTERPFCPHEKFERVLIIAVVVLDDGPIRDSILGNRLPSANGSWYGRYKAVEKTDSARPKPREQLW